MGRRQRLVAYAFVSPWVVGFVAFTLGPMLLSLVASFTDYPVLHAADTRFVGLANYRTALGDHVLAHSLVVTLLYTVMAVPADLAVGLALALVLNARARGVSVFRTVFFLPVMIGGAGGGSVAVALLWVWIFQPRFGLLNGLFGLVGLPPQLWVASTRLVVPSLVIMSMWGVGRTMLIFLAGLQGLDRDVLHAAEMDGASAFRRLFRVTLPLLSPLLLFNLVLDLINALQTFTQTYVVTQGQGGPHDASLFYMLYLFRTAFTDFKMGYASALAWILFAITLGLTFLIFRTARSWVFYGGGPR